MHPERDKKHVVMLVANAVSGDSRVEKTALAADEAGYRVTVIGRSTSGSRSVEQLGNALVVRVPIRLERLEAVKQGLLLKGKGERRAEQLEEVIGARTKVAEVRAANAKARLDRSIGRAGNIATTARAWTSLRVVQSAIKLQSLAGVIVGAARRSLARRTEASHDDRSLATRKRLATFLDIEDAYLEELAGIDFDLVHAHDSTMIGCARKAADRAATLRRRPAFVYDAHEYVRGLTNLPPEIATVNIELEQENIAKADAIVTVSPVLANLLQQHYGLAETPALVLNAPLATRYDAHSPLSVRAQCGLEDDQPLLVYAGVVKPLRGISTVVRALPELPHAHLALVVSDPEARTVRDMLNEASIVGCADRVHTVPYVAQDQVINHLRTADVGLYPLLRSGNTALSWPTKVFEYLHAGLPMVVSDMPSMAEIVTRHGWGEVFAADDEQAFAAAVQRVLSEPERYQAGLHEPLTREQFSWEQQAQTLIAIYDRLLFGARGSKGTHASAVSCDEVAPGWTATRPQ